MLGSYLLHLRGEKSEQTIRAYRIGITTLRDYLVGAGLPTDVRLIRREHIDGYIDDQLAKNAPSTAKLRRTFAHAFFAWLVDEGEIDDNPVRRAKVPKVGDKPDDALRDADWAKLLSVVSGRGFLERRDAAILRVLESSGLRRAEVAGLRVGQVNIDDLTLDDVLVKGGDRELRVIDGETAKAIDRWLRTRKDGAGPNSPLWVSRTGRPLTPEGIADVVARRARQAGVQTHAHAFRHRWIGLAKAANISDEQIMALTGHKDVRMLKRYSRRDNVTRAVASFRRSRTED
jgi:site-specific recombinase XerD